MTKSRFAVAAFVGYQLMCGSAAAQVRPPATTKPVAKAPVAAAPAANIEVLKVDLSTITVSEGTTASAIRGVMSPDAENSRSEKDSHATVPRLHSALLGGFTMSPRTRRLKDDPKVQTYLDVAKLGLNGFEIHSALLAGHKYMISDCVGIKVSAGLFVLKVPDPDLRVENTGIVLTFSIPHIEMTAVSLRFRPDVSDLMQPCHFSGSQGVGVTADNVRLEMHFDPILDLLQCKIGSMGHMTQLWRIGKLRMSPLPSAVADLSANIVEDALTYASNFNVVDRVTAAFNGAAGSQCHA